MSAGGWNTIESDAGVFTELVERLNVENVEFEELYSFDQSTLAALQPLYGVIFLFKYSDLDQSTIGPVGGGEFDHEESIFFAKQRIQNACATQAVLNILLNKTDQVKIGEELTNFKEFVNYFDSDLKGETISNSDLIRTIHNSFSSPNQFVDEQQSNNKIDDDDNLFHFIGYIRVNNKIIELDGLKPFPISHGECLSDEEFIERLPQVLTQRINQYKEGELRFSLLALVKDRRELLKEFGDEDGLEKELVKREKWKTDNELRRCDLIGLVNQALKTISAQNEDTQWNDLLKRASLTGSARFINKKLKRGL
ncbi:hypothetical protein WICMUC_002286 [Wickerhamomyces mucosus]|uniref:Ubiquitin carboxyl-terminal hydrolase n=1 Tax=Wickerhamomyces mucosus TaxID=1378264 RepID=A0A9P8PR09_9ASCO|nr:hypothetical protein WICMUC_002286 [Wickerhamomyces mucosus]